MPQKITYLLGAGASANSIPVVPDMYWRIGEISDFLKKKMPTSDIREQAWTAFEERREIMRELTSDFSWLLEEGRHSPSLDTLAKQYYLSGDHNENYERLKKCLIEYFTIEQFMHISSNVSNKYSFEKNVWDKRYDSFVASIGYLSDDKVKLNSNIKILSWNYDLQLELSLKRLTKKSINQVKKTFQIFPY
jgi:hypothetical protein